ncbi:MAG: ATP-binding protein [Thermoproteota archaeon]|nr:ATP-binding protein [Thermoproteota archaeon]
MSRNVTYLHKDGEGVENSLKNKKEGNPDDSEIHFLLEDVQNAKEEIMLLLTTTTAGEMIKLKGVKEEEEDEEKEEEQKRKTTGKLLEGTNANGRSLKTFNDLTYDLFLQLIKSSVNKGITTKILVPAYIKSEHNIGIKNTREVVKHTNSLISDTLNKFIVLANELLGENTDNSQISQRKITKGIEIKFFESSKIKEKAVVFLLLLIIIDKSSAYIIKTATTNNKTKRQSKGLVSPIRQSSGSPQGNFMISPCTDNLDLLCHLSSFENLWNQSIDYQKSKDQAKMQEEFINVAAHELRTPIQPILLGTNFLYSIIKDPDQARILRIINSNAKKLKNLSEDILEVSRIESNTLTINKELVNLNDLIHNIVTDFRTSLTKDDSSDPEQENVGGTKRSVKTNEGYTLDEETTESESATATRKLLFFEKREEEIGEEDVFVVEADRNRISQVLTNLLTNATKFTSEKDCIIVSIGEWRKSNGLDAIRDEDSIKLKELEKDLNQERDFDNFSSPVKQGKEKPGKSSNIPDNLHSNQCIPLPKEKERSFAEIQVKDTGKGIEESIIPRLFTKFASNSYKGIGLGLFISKAIVEAHGGSIWAENNKDGRGCTFHFTLPLVKMNKSSQQNLNKQTEVQQVPQVNIKRILIVIEDNITSSKLRKVLEEANRNPGTRKNPYPKTTASLMPHNNYKASTHAKFGIIYNIDIFNEPSIALDNFIIGYYDLIIIDIEFTTMSGFDFCKSIRQKDKKAKVCFLASGETHYRALNDIYGTSSVGNEQFIDRGDIDNDSESLLEQINSMLLA